MNTINGLINQQNRVPGLEAPPVENKPDKIETIFHVAVSDSLTLAEARSLTDLAINHQVTNINEVLDRLITIVKSPIQAKKSHRLLKFVCGMPLAVVLIWYVFNRNLNEDAQLPFEIYPFPRFTVSIPSTFMKWIFFINFAILVVLIFDHKGEIREKSNKKIKGIEQQLGEKLKTQSMTPDKNLQLQKLQLFGENPYKDLLTFLQQHQQSIPDPYASERTYEGYNQGIIQDALELKRQLERKNENFNRMKTLILKDTKLVKEIGHFSNEERLIKLMSGLLSYDQIKHLIGSEKFLRDIGITPNLINLIYSYATPGRLGRHKV